MSFAGLLNKTCSSTRMVTGATDSAYATKTATPTAVLSNVATRITQFDTREDTEDIDERGEHFADLELMFFVGEPDILSGDVITVSGDSIYERHVMRPYDAAGHGHHTEFVVRRVKIL